MGTLKAAIEQSIGGQDYDSYDHPLIERIGGGSLMSDRWIRKNLGRLVDMQRLALEVDKGAKASIASQVNPASLDLRLGQSITVKEWVGGELGAVSERKLTLDMDDMFTFYPGRLYICHSLEYVTMPTDVSAVFLMKSTLGRLGLDHLFSGWVDSGFSGQLVFEFHAIIPVTIPIGRRVGQLVFWKQNTASDKPYRGKYSGQIGSQDAIEGGVGVLMTQIKVVPEGTMDIKAELVGTRDFHLSQASYYKKFIEEATQRVQFHEAQAQRLAGAPAILDAALKKAANEAVEVFKKANAPAPVPQPPAVASDIWAVVPSTKARSPLAEGYEVGQNFLQMCDIEAYPGEVFEAGSRVEFWLDGTLVRTEGGAPYTMSGRTYAPASKLSLSLGVHTLRVVALNRAGAVHKNGRASRTISFVVK